MQDQDGIASPRLHDNLDLGILIPNIPSDVQAGPPALFYAAALHAWQGLRAWTDLLREYHLWEWSREGRRVWPTLLHACHLPVWVPERVRQIGVALETAARDAWRRLWLGQCFARPSRHPRSAGELADWCRFQRKEVLQVMRDLHRPAFRLDGRFLPDEDLLALAVPLLKPTLPGDDVTAWTAQVERLEWDGTQDIFSSLYPTADGYSYLIRQAWDRLRPLPGRCKPDLPDLPVDEDGAEQALDLVVLWCAQQGEPPPEEATTRRRMTVAQANQKAMELAKKEGAAFFLLSERAQARRIGCHWKTWTKTEFYRTAEQMKRCRAKRIIQGPSPASPPVVSLTAGLEEQTGFGDRNEVLEQLIAEQKADNDSNPQDPRPRKVWCRKRL
jgi:hypothetical protein